MSDGCCNFCKLYLKKDDKSLDTTVKELWYFASQGPSHYNSLLNGTPVMKCPFWERVMAHGCEMIWAFPFKAQC